MTPTGTKSAASCWPRLRGGCPALLRTGEYATRLGGDEFVLILENLDGQLALDAVMRRVSEALNAPFSLTGGVELRVGTSIGVAVYPCVEDGHDLLCEADHTLYRSKANKSAVSISEPRAARWLRCPEHSLRTGGKVIVSAS